MTDRVLDFRRTLKFIKPRNPSPLYKLLHDEIIIRVNSDLRNKLILKNYTDQKIKINEGILLKATIKKK